MVRFGPLTRSVPLIVWFGSAQADEEESSPTTSAAAWVYAAGKGWQKMKYYQKLKGQLTHEVKHT